MAAPCPSHRWTTGKHARQRHLFTSNLDRMISQPQISSVNLSQFYLYLLLFLMPCDAFSSSSFLLPCAFLRSPVCSCCPLAVDGHHFSLLIHKKGSQRTAACTVILQLLTLHSFSFTRLTVWTAMPTLALLPHLQPHSSHLPKLPLPHLLEVRCLRDRWLASAATLHLRQLYLGPMLLLRLPPALRLLPSQPVPPT